MTTIYLHPSALGMPEALERLRQLVAAGHELIVAGRVDGRVRLPAGSAHIDELPLEVPDGAWYLTADPTTCGDRRADLHTLLVGPRLDERRPTRCDSTARDMREAVLAILAADAMDR